MLCTDPVLVLLLLLFYAELQEWVSIEFEVIVGGTGAAFSDVCEICSSLGL